MVFCRYRVDDVFLKNRIFYSLNKFTIFFKQINGRNKRKILKSRVCEELLKQTSLKMKLKFSIIN